MPLPMVNDMSDVIYNFGDEPEYMDRCDRCLKLHLPKEGGRVSLKEGLAFARSLKLCPKCLEEVKKVVFVTVKD